MVFGLEDDGFSGLVAKGGAMKRIVVMLLVLVVGVVAGRLSIQLPANAEGRGGQEPCSSINGDVDGNGTVEVLDIITLILCQFALCPSVINASRSRNFRLRKSVTTYVNLECSLKQTLP